MPFDKGKEKTGGREKGVENKTTQEARELFTKALEGQVHYIEESFALVREKDPAKYLELFAKYAQYFVPKQLDVNLGGKIIKVIPPGKKQESE